MGNILNRLESCNTSHFACKRVKSKDHSCSGNGWSVAECEAGSLRGTSDLKTLVIKNMLSKTCNQKHVIKTCYQKCYQNIKTNTRTMGF